MSMSVDFKRIIICLFFSGGGAEVPLTTPTAPMGLNFKVKGIVSTAKKRLSFDSNIQVN